MDLEAQYNNRARVPDHPAIMADWSAWSATTRADMADRAELDLAYSDDSERTMVDLFWPEAAGDDTPLAVFIHGGYWQALDRKAFSFVAKGVTARGVGLAVPSYDLCPDVPLSRIIDQMRRLCHWLYRRRGRRFAVSGHSAGGHLTAAMMATNWTTLDPVLPADLVRHGMAISGLFDLEPLIATSINDKLNLDAAEARRLSPLHCSPPADAYLDLLVGGDESDAFIAQSRDMAADWSQKGAVVTMLAPPGDNHFTVISPLMEAGSGPTQSLADLARAAHAL